MGLYKSTISKRSDKQWLRFKHPPPPTPPPPRYVSRNGLTIRGLRVENLRVSDTLLYSVDKRTAPRRRVDTTGDCNNQLWARAVLTQLCIVIRSDSDTMKMTAVIQYILTTAKSFDFQDYYSKFLMTILELAGVLFCENEKT